MPSSTDSRRSASAASAGTATGPSAKALRHCGAWPPIARGCGSANARWPGAPVRGRRTSVIQRVAVSSKNFPCIVIPIVGASLLAKRPAHSTLMLPDAALSRTGALPQGTSFAISGTDAAGYRWPLPRADAITGHNPAPGTRRCAPAIARDARGKRGASRTRPAPASRDAPGAG